MDEEAVHALWREYFLVHNAFLEKEKLLVVADAIAKLVTRGSTTEEEEELAIKEGRPTAKRIIRLMLETNLSAIYDYTESPIEKMFLGAVQWISALCGPIPIQFIAPKHRAEDYPAFFAGRYQSVIKQWQAFQQQTGKREVHDFLRAVNHLYKSGQMSAEEHDEIERNMLYYYGSYKMYHRYHFMPQARFDKYKVQKRRIRVDLLIWKPSDPSIKIVVECDGYKYHADQTTFSRDRARDRILQQHGYQVLRYSGSEIYADPFGKAQELCTYLLEKERNERN